MIHQTLEFYPDTDKCIQGCLHCPRSIQNISESTTISRVSDIQMQMTQKILRAFENEEKKGVFALNLSWYLWSYDFELFPDLWEYKINQIYFNLGTLWEKSINFLDEFNDKFQKILPIGSNNYMELYWNLQHSSWLFRENDIQKLEIFFRKYKKIIEQENERLNNTNEVNLLLAANNVSNRNFKVYREKRLFWKNPLMELLHHIHRLNASTLNKSQIKSKTPSLLNWSEVWLVQANSKIIKSDWSLQTIDFRWINAKAIQYYNFKEDIMNCVEDKEKFLLGIFPDKVIVYHNTIHINQNIYWFTYEEFLPILEKSLSEKVSLKDEVDIILLKRLEEI